MTDIKEILIASGGENKIHRLRANINFYWVELLICRILSCKASTFLRVFFKNVEYVQILKFKFF